MLRTNPTKGNIYGNYKVHAPTGELMFRCGEDKANWYLSRNLATISPADPKSITLTFEPKGKGFVGQTFFLQERDNRCVVCGVREDLSRHHVVPYCYRVNFPHHIREHNYHDILPVCVNCHSAYEEFFALTLRKELATKYDAPLHGLSDSHLDSLEFRARKGAIALLRHGSRMPQERRLELFCWLNDYLGRPPTEDDIKATAGLLVDTKDPNYKSHGKLVVEKLTSLQDFVELWRLHFIASMNPKFLPEGWDPKMPVDIATRNRNL